MKTRKLVKIIFLVWIILLIAGGFTLRYTLPGRSNASLPEPGENEVRLAFFADPHITNPEMGTETDIGGHAYDIPKKTIDTINKTNPDYSFGLGDLTAHTTENEWVGYRNWIGEIDSTVYDVLGNHDKEHLHGVGSYGTEYFTIVGRVDDTKVLKHGNNVFILVSEEHGSEGDGRDLLSAIPEKRFNFIEDQLEKYSEDHNIFIMNHTPLHKTTAFSTYNWHYTGNPNWVQTSEKFENLLSEYENSVVAHITGHIHSDYRMKDPILNLDKFVDGGELKREERNRAPYSLPDVHFLNMPVVDIHHNWFPARFPRLSYIVNSLDLHPATQEVSSEDHEERVERNFSGPPIMDYFHNTKNSYFTGRGAIYHFELEEGKEKVRIATRWISGNRDVENYYMNLNVPVKLNEESMQRKASDLSLRRKNENLIIELDNWFKIKENSLGFGEFSRAFYQENKVVTGLSIDNYNLANYHVEWKGSTNYGENWTNSWYENSEDLGEINAIKMRIKFEPKENTDAFIEDIEILDNSSNS